MIDVTTEELIPFQRASGKIPGNPHISTIHRWRLRGVRGARLESVLVGNTRYTSIQAISRFVAALNAGESANSEVTPGQRERQSQAARLELEKLGI
jgi:hypothetical protein